MIWPEMVMPFYFRVFFLAFFALLLGFPETGKAQTDFLFPSAPQLRIIFAGETRGYLHPCAT